MRKFILLWLVVCLLLSGCADLLTEETFPTYHKRPTDSPETTGATASSMDITEATTPSEPPHTPFYDPEVSVEDVIAYFNEVCLDAEVVNSGDASVIQKWDVPIYYYINGTPTEEDLLVLENFTAWLNTIEGFPGIARTTDLNQLNLNIYFCSAQQLLDIMGNQFEGNDGAVVFWYSNDAIYNENICIRTDLDQTLRNSVIMEELYNGMGPIQDTSLREDSLIFSGFSSPQEMTDMDKLIMQLLYHPDIKCGMDAQTCAQIIRELYQ